MNVLLVQYKSKIEPYDFIAICSDDLEIAKLEAQHHSNKYNHGDLVWIKGNDDWWYCETTQTDYYSIDRHQIIDKSYLENT